MKYTLFLFLILAAISSSYSQNVGINTETPMATLDVNGDVIFRVVDLVPPELTTNVLDVNTTRSSAYRISGPVMDFTIHGISSAIDGRMITLLNQSGFTMSLMSEDASVDPVDQIITGTNDTIILADRGVIMLQYDSFYQKWIVKNTSNSGGTAVWESMGNNAIFNEGYVGIGTEDPVSPLTVMTEVDQPGITQIGGLDSITMATTIHEGSASIGTTTDHVFSLNAGGSAKVHIRPDGNVVFGNDPDPLNLTSGNTQSRMVPIPMAKHTLESGLNTTGWVHIATSETDTIIVDEAVGGVSSSLGTLSNHAFRLKTNATGRFHILSDGRITISPNDYGPVGQLTVYQPVADNPNNNGITVVTPNNTNGVVQIGGEGQRLAMRIGGSSGSIGTWTPHIMRIVSNGVARINIDIFGNVAIGLPDPLPGYMLSVNGHVKCRELVVETAGWPDYVFGDNHRLLPLLEVEQFINQHKHLPNIPAARELEEGGLMVGEMQKKMMEKIEELTLYVIELKKEIEHLKGDRQ